MCIPVSHFFFLVFIPLGQLLIFQDVVQVLPLLWVSLSHPYLVIRRNSWVLWAGNSTFQFSHALCQELWRKWIFISSQARKLACQLHAGRRQENHGLETMGFINHSTASNTRFTFRLVILLFSPVVWGKEPKQVQSRQWNPKYREFESIDGLRANPSTLVPKGSVIFITLDNKQAHALLCVEMPTLSSKAFPLYSLGEDKWERKGS